MMSALALMSACSNDEKEIREVAGKIRATGIEYVCTGHCTKDRAYNILHDELGNMAVQMRVGYMVEF